MRNTCFACLIVLLFACTPKLNGTFEGAIDQWLLDSGGEYPVEYYRFKHKNRFKYEVIFCYPNERGSGRFSIRKDSIQFKFKYLNDPEEFDEWEISDTTWTMPFRMVNDSLLLINGVEFKKCNRRIVF
jgi:hypothetical protein